MKRALMSMLAFTVGLASSVVPVKGSLVTWDYSGTITDVINANSGLPIDFAPIPSGSFFSGSFTYDSDSAKTGGFGGLATYFNLGSEASESLTVNGYTFMTAAPPGFANPGLQVSSAEAGFGFSGVIIGTQPISLPPGWSAPYAAVPYFTLQFLDIPAQERSLALPVTAADLTLGNSSNLILDFQNNRVTVNGATYLPRVYVEGTIASLSFESAVPEPNYLALMSLGAGMLVVLTRVRAHSSGRSSAR